MMQNKSEQSTTFQPMHDISYLQCMQKLKQQNQYLKQALKTAESLIDNYKKQYSRLEMQSKIVVTKMKKIQRKYQELVFKLQGYEQDSREIDQIKSNQYMQMEQVERLNTKIKELVDVQVKYQDKINELEHKLVLLQKSKCDKKISKHQFALNFNGPNNSIMNTISTKDKKPKNLNDLRSLHMKIKTRQSLSDRVVQQSKSGKGLVERVFSRDKNYDPEKLNSEPKRKDGGAAVKRKC